MTLSPLQQGALSETNFACLLLIKFHERRQRTSHGTTVATLEQQAGQAGKLDVVSCLTPRAQTQRALADR